MFGFRPLPWEYGIRNLFRRPLRSGLTLVALTTVTLLVLVVVGFLRGLERMLTVSGDPALVIVFSQGMGENLEYSSIGMSISDLVAASIPGIQERYGRKYASPELYLGTQVRAAEGAPPGMGLVRGVTPAALLVHRQVELLSGTWPRAGEVMIGRLVATKLGARDEQLGPGSTVEFEGHTWRVSGTFAAAGGAFESELWCRLDDLQQVLKRQDLSLVVLALGPTGKFQDVDLFCKERIDLELQAIRQTEYYAALQKDYAPVRMVAWLVVALVSGAGVFVGLNTMYGAVVGRIPEIAMLQTLGFSRRAAVLSLVQEGTILAMLGTLIAAVLAFLVVHRAAVNFTMGAFELRVDGGGLLFGCITGLVLGVLGSFPAALRVFRLSVVQALKAV
jgi:ABC-type lipoprotein release transport system permease subunit